MNVDLGSVRSEKKQRITTVRRFVTTIEESDQDTLNNLEGLLELANKDRVGRKIIFSDLSSFAIKRLTEKEINEIKQLTLTREELAKIKVEDVNRKLNANYTQEDLALLGAEFLLDKEKRSIKLQSQKLN